MVPLTCRPPSHCLRPLVAPCLCLSSRRLPFRVVRGHVLGAVSGAHPFTVERPSPSSPSGAAAPSTSSSHQDQQQQHLGISQADVDESNTGAAAPEAPAGDSSSDWNSPEAYVANKQLYREEDYLTQRQSKERSVWASTVRNLTLSRDPELWEPKLLDPPALLCDVTVVLMSPRRPVSVGAAARACSSFECEDMRIVAPRCDHLSRQATSASHGAQYVLHRVRGFSTLKDALADVDLSIAFTRWVEDRPSAVINVDALLQHPVMQQMLTAPGRSAAAGADPRAAQDPLMRSVLERLGRDAQDTDSSQPMAAAAEDAVAQGAAALAVSLAAPAAAPKAPSHGATQEAVVGVQGGAAAGALPRRPRVALVFGREELGISDEEVDTCDVACSILIGRLQESLSLTHAMTIALSTLFQHRMQCLAQAALTGSA